MVILSMKGYSFVLGISIIFLIVVSYWNFVTATNPVVKTPANVTLFSENTNNSHPLTPLMFSNDTSNYVQWKLSGR